MLKPTMRRFAAFFVDTNIIEYYLSGRQEVVKFIRDPNNTFYYTETVLSEWLIPERGNVNGVPRSRVSDSLLRYVETLDTGEGYDITRFFSTNESVNAHRKYLLKETDRYYKYLNKDKNLPSEVDSILSGDSDTYFKFIHSGKDYTDKLIMLHKLQELWNERFREDKMPISDKKMKKFEKDLFIIGEASVACCKSLPLFDAPFLTNNLDLVRSFISDEKRASVLEDAINYAGFDHLVEIKTMVDIIDRDRVMP